MGRKLKPPEQIQRMVVGKPETSGRCGALLFRECQQLQRHQVSELPKIELEFTEDQLHILTCLVCGTPTTGNWPKDIPEGSFGPWTQAMVGYLNGSYGISDWDVVVELMEVSFHTEIGLGSVFVERILTAQCLPCTNKNEMSRSS